MQSQTPLVRREVSVNVFESRIFGRWTQRSFRVIAVASLFLTLTAMGMAQSSIQTITADDGAQAGSQPAGATLEGNISDAKGGLIGQATIVVRNDATGRIKTATADAMGHFSIAGLAIGTYTVDASAPGFATATLKNIHVAADHTDSAALTLQIGSATADITVEADATGSVAAALAPMDALLNETSARTEVTSAMIQNFMSPITDYAEAVEMTPGTFTTNSNGVGLGQATTIFRGFPDGDYDIDFDGIPFYDTNTPSHHSWAFFPGTWLGGIDFDRSPGTASTIGPTPFGGSIHLLSKPFSPVQDIRGEFSGGSYHTYLYDVQYDSGQFGPGRKFNTEIDVHHLQSDGYQTFNFQTRNAGDIQVQYKLSDKTTITGFSGVIWVDANTPNFSATRCQMFGVSATKPYNCFISGTTLYPETGAGINFLNTNNSNPLLYLDYKYNYYHVPTDFEYVGVHKEFGHNFVLDTKPYTYNYDNSEKYTNATTITEDSTINGSKTYMGLTVAPCSMPVTKKGVTAEPCGVDKYNSYRKYGETSELTQVSKFGTFHAGFWYEWARTSRHQFPSDPLNNWADQLLSNFNEKFVTNSYQPYAEYQLNAGKKLVITAGVKFAYYTVSTQQFADDGKTIGGLGTNNPATFVTDGGSYFATLPSLDANYHIKKNWTVYGQVAQGSVVPPSSVFDFSHGTSDTNLSPFVLPKQQKNTTYQAGTVFKLKRATFDADYYRVHFDNSYSSTLDSSGEPVFFVQPSSITEGIEGESNLYFGNGLSLYLNATYGKAYYKGTLAAVPSPSDPAAAPVLNVSAPSGQNVQMTPSDTETEGLTYQHKAFDFGIFNKRVGTFFIDNGAFHNQDTIDPFSLTNLFFNYTIRTGGKFDQTKIQLSFNNLFNSHSITGDVITGTANVATLTQTVNNVTYTYSDPFATLGPTPINGQDNISILPGRSIMLSVIFGFGPHHH
jgi:iron complex outermembrane recepter protein